MSFPNSPSNGQTYRSSNGNVWLYSSSNNSWGVVDSLAPGITGIQGAMGLSGVGATGIQGIGATERPYFFAFDSAGDITITEGAQGATGLGIQGAAGLGVAGTGSSSGATGVINLPMDGGGLPITGLICDIKLPNSIRVNSWTIVTAGDTGSMTLGIWRKDFESFPPTNSDAMHTGATGPFIRATDILKRQGTTSGWQGATGASNDWVRVHVTQSDNQISKATLALDYNII